MHVGLKISVRVGKKVLLEEHNSYAQADHPGHPCKVYVLASKGRLDDGVMAMLRRA